MKNIEHLMRYMDVSPFFEALAEKNVRFCDKLGKQLEKLFSEILV